MPSQELPWQDPIVAFQHWANDPFVTWLDAQGRAEGRGRYSYLAIEPFRIIAEPDPFAVLAEAMAEFAETGPDLPVPFRGGAVGFLGYELGSELGRAGRHHGLAFPDASFALYDVVLAFDRLARRVWLIASGFPERTPAARATRARARSAAVASRLAGPAPDLPAAPPLAWTAETLRAAHEARVARAIALIEAGEMCQANITARFLADRPANVSAAALHLALRAGNAAPYGAFIGCGEGMAVAGVSPERLVGLTRDGLIEARPIKGTRPRDTGPARDAALAAELLASAKDRAENLMIVDLLRHDIGRVAEIGSVHVPELTALESFANVHHLVSTVQGRLLADASAVDLLRAVFPGGSVTGAPKKRAMEVIHALEPSPRGAYCGAVAWLGWDGAMDSSVAIRTLMVTRDQVIAQAGGGIVADSDPAAEYEEMMVKIRPLLRALGPFAG